MDMDDSFPYRCPRCGQSEHFSIEATSTFDVNAEGAEQIGDIEWNDPSRIQCPDCDQIGTVAEFVAAYEAHHLDDSPHTP